MPSGTPGYSAGFASKIISASARILDVWGSKMNLRPNPRSLTQLIASPRRPATSATLRSNPMPGISARALKAAARSAGLVIGSLRISKSLSTVAPPL